ENPAASLPADDPGHAAVPDAPGERGAYLADLAEEALPSYDAGAGLLSMLSGLLLVLALLAGLVWVARRVSGGRFLPGGRGSGPIRVLATRAVGPRQGLVLAEVGGLVWLLSQGPEGLRLVAEIRDEAALAQLDQRYGFRQTPFEAALRSRLDLESGAAAGPPGSEVAKGPEPTPEERLAALRRRPPAGGSP
ncbi:MAG: flagellar biosynthetic protein FliO, partial [Deferrisomatales bacterium]|nr:flagellar biosynthetic protein FliO [Deferrisomatales bacterium]